MSASRRSARTNRVVPVAVKLMSVEADRGHLCGGDGHAFRVACAIHFGPDAQPGPAPGRSDEADDRREAHQRRPAPCHRDVREEAMLDPIPLARTGGK